MPEEKKEFGTPLAFVRFTWENGQDQTVAHVVERGLYVIGGELLLILKDTDGAHHAVRGWTQMEQAPGPSLI